MRVRRLLERLEAQRDNKELLQSVGRDLGHDLAAGDIPGLDGVVAGLPLSGGQPLKPWIAGYRSALGDVFCAFLNELGVSGLRRSRPKFKIGTPVVLWGDGRNPRCRKEYGLVVRPLWNSILQCWEYQVVFFGYKWPPVGAALKKPYTLRYLETSLRTFTAEEKHGSST